MKKYLNLLLIPIFSYALTMEEAVNVALQNNLYLKQLNQDIKIATTTLKEDKNLWMPQIFLNYSYTILKDTPYTKIPANSSIGIPPIEFKFYDINFSNFEFGINYPVFTGFQRANKINISKSSIKQAKYIYKEEKNNLIHKTKIAYLDALKAKAVLSIYEKQKEAIKAHLNLTKEYLKEGLITRLDVLQTKVKLSQIEKNIQQAKSNLNLAKSYLNTIMNKPLDSSITLHPVEIDINQNISLKQLYEKAINNRYILKAVKQKQNQLKYLENIQKGEFYPKVIAQGKYFYTNQNPYLDPFGNFSLSISVNWEFQGIKPYYKLLKVKQQQNKLSLKIKNLKTNIKLQVKKAYEEFITAKQNLKVANDALKEAEEYFELVNQQFKNQLATTTDVINAESYLTSARQNKVISYYEMLKAYINLEKVIGEKLY